MNAEKITPVCAHTHTNEKIREVLDNQSARQARDQTL